MPGAPDASGSTGTGRRRISSSCSPPIPPRRRMTGSVAGEIDDRRLDADRTGTAVEDHVDVVAEIGAHVGCGRGTHPAEPVGRRRRQPAAEPAQQLQRERMIGNAHADGVAPAGDLVGHLGRPSQHQGERARPTLPRQLVGRVGHAGRQLVDGGGGADVDDHRMRPRPPLDRVEPAQRLGIGGIDPQPVHRLGRERDEAAPAQDACGAGHAIVKGVGVTHSTIFAHL